MHESVDDAKTEKINLRLAKFGYQMIRFCFTNPTRFARGRKDREIENKYPSLRSGTGKTNILALIDGAVLKIN